MPGGKAEASRSASSSRRGRTETLVISFLALAAVGLAAAGLLRRGRGAPALESSASNAVELGPWKVDINSAPCEELRLVPGIGPKLSRRIVEYRERHGPFETVLELDRVWGIGLRLVERIEPYVVAGRPKEPGMDGPKPVRGAIEE